MLTKAVVFLDRGMTPWFRNTPLRRFRAALRAGGVPNGERIGLKTLRHTFAYLMVNHVGCPLPIVQQCMGHADISMTMRYVRPGDAGPFLERYQSLLLSEPVATVATSAFRTG